MELIYHMVYNIYYTIKKVNYSINNLFISL
nr:MAG TPA: hypothetical protein [Caudoviricetes sp.]